MRKMYIVRPTDQEPEEPTHIVKKPNGTGRKVRRARSPPKAGTDDPNCIDRRIAEPFSCRNKTVENLRQRLDGVERTKPPIGRSLDGEHEARIGAMRPGPPPKGSAKRTLRLPARRAAEMGDRGADPS